MNDIFSLAEGMSLQGGKYTIVRMLSHGGFGVTYLAYHNLLDVDVCIKEFFPAVWCNRDAFSYEVSVSTTGNVDMVDRFMQKFIKEAQSIARLHHEGIVKFHDVFEENGTAYYVMDFIEGQTLQQMVKDRGALPLSEAIGYIRQAAEALGYLHGKRMNHLDVKPANMMIDRGGKLTLIDFGVAKHYGEDGHQTTTTPMCISRGYSPIEQYKDGGVSQFSPAADIYPLGATLYYLLTGTVPPEATELAVDELVIPDTIPTHIAEAIRHAMESKPSRRTPSAAAFVDELGEENSYESATEATVALQDTEPIDTASQLPNIGMEEDESQVSPEDDQSSQILPPDIDFDIPKEKTFREKLLSKNVLISVGAILFLVVFIIVYYNSSPKSNVSLLSLAEAVNHEGNTGDLAFRKDMETLYISPENYKNLSNEDKWIVSQGAMCVVINIKGKNSYIALHDKANGKEMTWDEAVSLFGENILPSEEQCRAMANKRDKINKAMRTFGGTEMDGLYWGKGRDFSSAWTVDMAYGNVYGNYKANNFRVRPVSSVADSAK